MRVVLVRPQEPGNIGSAARAMKNFGLSELVLVAPQRPLTKEAFYLATHAKDVLENARTVDSVPEAIRDCTLVLGTSARGRRSDAHDVYTPRDAAGTFAREGLAVLFGPEASGLSNEDLDYCQAFIRIPTGAFSSLNLAQAVNLIAYEFFVTQVSAGHSKLPDDLADREALERLYAHFLETALHIGYAHPDRPVLTEHMYRRIFDRARLTTREVAALHGLWRQVRWAAEHMPEERPGREKKR
jgi:tRNA/rRNA methyltransferase